MGLFGAALFYGDGLITPAISVLSAVEGLEVATPALKPYVIPITLIVLVVLFFVQKRGTGRVGALFGPIMIVWFVTLAVLGVIGIVRAPQVLAALNPLVRDRLPRHTRRARLPLAGRASCSWSPAQRRSTRTWATSAAGRCASHGRRSCFPALALNYFGQGALLLADPEAIENPFYLLAPAWALYPLVALATVATIIASQAVISGAFSITQQAMQLGYAPRMEVQHTSSHEIGQIYLPGINRALLVGVVALVLGFGSSTSLAAAYGIAVTGTMAITTVLAFVVARRMWHWSLPASIALFGAFLLVDVGILRRELREDRRRRLVPARLRARRLRPHVDLEARARPAPRDGSRRTRYRCRMFVKSASLECTTVPGTAVFMTASPEAVPHALLHSMKHYKSLHERVVLLTAVTLDVPHVAAGAARRRRVDRRAVPQGEGLLRLHGRSGPSRSARVVRRAGTAARPDGHVVLPRPRDARSRPGTEMALWREKLFVAMYRNAGSVAAYFRLPPNRVVELGSQVVL